MIPGELDYEVILASGSPRRKELLSQLGIEFKVVKTDVDESYPEHLRKEEIPLYLARIKANSFNEVKPGELVITADTIVCLENEVLNKPGNEKEATEMLQKLSGKQHEVITAVHIRTHARNFSFASSTKVFFKNLRDEEIQYYVNTFKPYDKAGAYGIQEWIGLIGIERIEGSYFNVVGLPVFQLYEALRQF